MTANDNRARPYSTLRDGRIVWVTPEEHAAGPAKRSRLETDDEVRLRFRQSGKYHYPHLHGKELDAQLDYWDMKPRKWVDE